MTHRPVRPQPRRARRPARTLAALPLAALLGTAAGCATDGPETLDARCAVVVDGSGSADAKTGFDALDKLNKTMVPFLRERHCGSVTFAPITSASKASPCRENRVDLDPPTDATDDVAAIRDEAKLKAVLAARRMLTCAQQTNSGSDVLGGIARGAETLRSGTGKAALLVVSDFEQADKEFTLTAKSIATPEARRTAVDKLVGPRGVPQLSGMDVYPVGYGMSRRARPSEFPPFDAFWKDIVEGRGKGHVDDEYQH
ncbi:hypothetical protein [Streptomyces sp. NPDC089919]|uniref:hypothetical protein n=1 Tax=Streptomyces sp. NPDC089919 TaxID=3155188 RepID=UPI0034462B3D